MILWNLREAADFGADFRLIKDARVIEAARFVMRDRFSDLEHVGAANHFSDLAETKRGHDLADFLRDELHEVNRMSGIAGELFAKLGILRGHTDWTGVQVADAHHDAAERHQ